MITYAKGFNKLDYTKTLKETHILIYFYSFLIRRMLNGLNVLLKFLIENTEVIFY
jgi:hypothetical protein